LQLPRLELSFGLRRFAARHCFDLCETERVMANALEFRILENGDGWYWEVVAEHQVLARGVADSQQDACAQAAEAKQKAVEIGALDQLQLSTDF